MRKKVLALVLAVMVSCLTVGMLAGCSGGTSNSKYVGTWTPTSIEQSGMSYDLSSLGINGEDLLTFTLNSDGSASFKLGSMMSSLSDDADVQALTGDSVKWEESSNGVTIYNAKDKSDSFDATEKDGNLVIDASGVTMVFTKN